MMAGRVYNYICNHIIDAVALEDYDLNPNQQVGMQIAETTGIFKNMVLEHLMVPIFLVHPSKRTSFVERRKGVTKKDCIEFAMSRGLDIPPKKRGQPGLMARQREDLADAFIIGCLGSIAFTHKVNGCEPVPGDLVLDPTKGLVYNSKAILTPRGYTWPLFQMTKP